MAYSINVPIIAGLAILGSLTGVGIGRSTIAQINPAYFQTAGSHFYGDMAANRSSGRQPDLAGTDYLQADYAYSAAPTCIGCDAYPVDAKPRHDKEVDGLDGWSASASPEPVAAKVETADVEPPPAHREWIERYTTYTVTTEPVAQVEEAAPAQDES